MSNFDEVQKATLRLLNKWNKQDELARRKRMNDFVTGIIRTYVPIVVGAIVSWLLVIEVHVDTDTQAGLVIALTGILQALYYTAVRLISKKFPWAEGLLGSAKTPEYKENK